MIGSSVRGGMLVGALTLAVASGSLLGGDAWAAGALRMRAVLEPTRVGVGEQAQITVIVEAQGLKIPDFALPSVPGLKSIRVADTQSFSWVNGALSRSSTSVFLVSATAPGRYTIPPIRIASGAARTETEPLVLQVGGPGVPPSIGGGGGAPAPGAEPPPRVWGDQSLPELFVRLEVDRRQAFWNQQILARFIFYTREHLDETPMWEIAEAPGFWKEPLGEVRRSRVRVGNADYVAFEQDVAYFPTRTGRLTLGPGRIEARVVRRVDAPDPWSFLALPETRVETIPLQTEAAAIVAHPLPRGAPSGFQGAVGKLSMTAKVDHLVARAGEPVTVTTILSGAGNLNTAGDPEIKVSPPLRSFESGGSVSTARAGLGVRGERRHEVAFVPEVPGAFVVAPIRFSWFDPEEGRYRTQVSDSIRVRVVVGGDSLAERAAPPEPPAMLRRGSGPRGSIALGPPAGAVEVGLGSMLALAAVAVVGRARRRAALDPRHQRRSALASGARALHALHGPGISGPEAASRAATLVGQGLGIRYGTDVEGMSLEETLRRVREAGAPEAVVNEARGLVEGLERIAFAPESTGSAPGGDLLAQAAALLDRLAAEVT